MNELECAYIGNVFDGSIMAQYKNSDVINNLRSRFPDNITECYSCPWKRHCQSGCANKNYQKYGKFETQSDKCDFYKTYFEELVWFIDSHKDSYQAL